MHLLATIHGNPNNTIKKLFTGEPWFNDYTAIMVLLFIAYPVLLWLTYIAICSVTGRTVRKRALVLLYLGPAAAMFGVFALLFFYAILDAFILSIIVDWFSVGAFYGILLLSMVIFGVFGLTTALAVDSGTAKGSSDIQPPASQTAEHSDPPT